MIFFYLTHWCLWIKLIQVEAKSVGIPHLVQVKEIEIFEMNASKLWHHVKPVVRDARTTLWNCGRWCSPRVSVFGHHFHCFKGPGFHPPPQPRRLISKQGTFGGRRVSGADSICSICKTSMRIMEWGAPAVLLLVLPGLLGSRINHEWIVPSTHLTGEMLRCRNWMELASQCGCRKKLTRAKQTAPSSPSVYHPLPMDVRYLLRL